MPLVKRKSPAPHLPTRAALDLPDPAGRRAAALEMTRQADVPALLHALAGEPVAEVREAIVTSLIGIRSEDAATGLVALLNHEDTALRNDAIEGLRCMGEAAAGALGAALRHADPDVRLFAVNALDQKQAPWARAPLRTVLAEEADVNIGLAAVEALAEGGGPEDAAALAAFAARFPDEPMVAFAVGVALDQIGAGAP
ncbi:HEAT repeat domain-containing protein [Roseomonas sp. AR75]|uniref:HEAT repeat domain-containing protein n=1 Tax=Roseomonas sp. AR75 TaxID=2562311 RepID=UPI0010C0F972|nr:HEAT repeat domain-containing protein [Roseomonas sp. AR75]